MASPRKQRLQSFVFARNMRIKITKLSRLASTLWAKATVIADRAKKAVISIYRWMLHNLLALIVAIILILLLLAAIVPISQNFEGNIIASELNFTYNGDSSKLILENIRNIRELQNEGVQTISFTGKFQSKSSPILDRSTSLKIQLPSSNSKWTIEPADPDRKKDSAIDLQNLRIQQGTKLNRLSYDFFRQQLSFYLKPAKNSHNNLSINLGTQPIKITVDNYTIPNSPNQTGDGKHLEFTLTPDNTEFNLDIVNNTKLYISLSKAPNFDTERWFKSNIETKDVKFIQIDKNGDLRDDVDISTIVEGKVRMVEQEREIKANQFLLGSNSNRPLGIQRIRHLQIIPKKGIEARFSGRDSLIQIGLDPDLPVSTIHGSWLDSFLPRDAIVALLSFSVSAVTSLIAWLFIKTSTAHKNP